MATCVTHLRQVDYLALLPAETESVRDPQPTDWLRLPRFSNAGNESCYSAVFLPRDLETEHWGTGWRKIAGLD